MRNFVLALALAAPLVQAGFAPSVSAQSQGQAQPGTIELQANPVGQGPVSSVPPDPANADSPVPAARPADPNYHGGPYAGALTAPPADAMNKSYPPCAGKLRDNCVNPGLARDMGRSHRRAADQ